MSDKLIIHDMEQGSDAWLKARFGVITATGYENVQAKGAGKSRAKYLRRLQLERIYGVSCGSDFKSGHMERGTEMEPEAIEAYAKHKQCEVQRVGFVTLGEWLGCSPDGLIGDDGGVETKCPMLTNHVGYIEAGVLPSAYKHQVDFSLAVTGRAYWDFVSYHPDAFNSSRDDRLFIIRVERDERICDEIMYECGKFIADLKKSIVSITGMEF